MESLLDLVDKNENVMDAGTILSKVFGEGYSSYILDVENDLVSEVKPSSDIKEQIPLETFCWSKEAHNVIEKLADSSYREALFNFMKLEHVAIAFKESKAPKELLFRKKSGVWRRAFVAPIEIEEGFTKQAILLLNSDFDNRPGAGNNLSDESFKKNRSYRDSLGTIMKFMYNDYESIYEIDVATDTYVALFVNPSVQRTPLPVTGCYSEANLHAADGYARPEYVKSRIEAGKLENLVERLSREKKVEFEFKTFLPADPWKRVIWQTLEYGIDGKPSKLLMAHSTMDSSKAEMLKLLRNK